MLAVYSDATRHAIQALVELARRPPDERVTVKSVALRGGYPPTTLAKTLGRLAEAGLVVSRKGPRGGFRLAVPPERIRLEDVALAIDGLHYREKCALGSLSCPRRRACPLHAGWSRARAMIMRTLRCTTIADLAPPGGSARPRQRASARAARRRRRRP
jgi:Rrf2 family protein